MNAFSLAIAAIRARGLQSSLCVLAGAAGIALLSAIFLISTALDRGLARNAEGVDVVVGAKGSPLQLVLSTVYHADVPTGNIEAEDAERVSHNPAVRLAVPLALGDNYHGWRIVGTTPDYLTMHHATLADGRQWNVPFEAVAGALTGLEVGDEFAGVHGFAADGDDVHHFHNYTIVGRLKPTGTVLDRLILTSVESVQQLHGHPDADDDDAAEEMKIAHQVTALLIKVKSPIAIMNLPRELNRSSNLLAASPSYEMARLSTALGFGRGLLTALGAGFVILSALMLLSVLASSLTARRYDLALLRVLGASRGRLSATILSEALVLSLAGALLGLVAGHLIAFFLSVTVKSLGGMVLPSALLVPQALDFWLLVLGGLAGLAAALVPAISAARTDIAALLARGRA